MIKSSRESKREGSNQESDWEKEDESLETWTWEDTLDFPIQKGGRPRLRSKTGSRRVEGKFFPAIGYEEAHTWHRVGPNALILMMHLKRWQALGAKPPYTIGDRLLFDLDVGPRTRDRALVALEKAGLVLIVRHRGRYPKIWLIDQVPASDPISRDAGAGDTPEAV